MSLLSTTSGTITLSDGLIHAGPDWTTGYTLVLNSGTLDLNGRNVPTGTLSGSAGGVITNGTTGAATLTVTQGTDATYAGGIQDGSGTVALTKLGAGTLTLTGSNSYSGGTTIGSGTLQIGNGGNAGTLGSGLVVDNAALAFNRSDVLKVSNNITGTGWVIQSGSGTLVLAGSNSYSGGTMINHGTLQVGNASALGNASSALTINGGELDLYGQSVTVGSLNGSAGAVITSGTAGSVTLTVNQGTDATYAGVIQDGSGTVALSKLGAGTLTLTGSNSYSGATIVDGGVLTITQYLKSPNLLVGNSGTSALNINGGTVTDVEGTIGLGNDANGTVTLTSGTWTNTDNVYVGYSNTGTLNINGGTVTSGFGYIALSGSTSGIVNVTSGTWANSGDLLVGKSGTGTLNISGGTVTNSDGFIGRDEGSRGTATITSGTWANSGGLYVGNYGTGTLNLIGSGVVTVGSGAGTLTLASLAGSTGTLNLGTGGAAGTLLAANVVGGSGTATLNFNHTGDYTFAPVLSGNLSVNKLGLGTTILTGSNNISGDISITEGALTIQNSLSSNAIYVGNSGTGTLNIRGATVNSSSLFLGQTSADSLGVVTVTGGTCNNVGSLFVGVMGKGVFTLNGGYVNTDSFQVGIASTSQGTLTLTSGTLASNSILVVGNVGTGTVNINGGTLLSNNMALIGASGVGTMTVTGGTWVNTGSVSLGEAGTGTLNLSGSGVVTVGSGTGTLTLASHAGSTGTLNLGTGGAAGILNAAVVTGGAGTAVVNFNHTGDYTFAPALSGTLGVNKLGSGTTNLTGSNTYTGPTTIQSGALLVNGSITSEVTVWNGGLLGGGGTIFGNVTNQGIVSPGNSPGTLTIGGNYTQTATGTLLIQIASPTYYDRLVVGGTAALGGTLQVSFLSGYKPKKGDTFQYLTAAYISGTFSNIDTGTLIGFAPSYLLTGTDATLGIVDLTAIQRSFAKDVPGLTPNQLAVAKGLDKVVNNPRVSSLVEYLDGIALAGVPKKLEMIVPTDLIPMFDASIASAQTQAFNLERRMEEIRGGATGFSASGLSLSDAHGTRSYNGNTDGKQLIGNDGKALAPAPISDRWGFFINGSGEFVDEESTTMAHGTDFTTGGITTGADYRLGDHAAVGLTAGYANTSANGRTDGTVKMDSGKLGVYGTVFDRGFFLNGVVGGGLNSYDTKRETLGGLARGNTSGSDFNALLGTGYTYRKGGFSAGPIGSVRYTWVGIDGFTERSSLAPLKIGEQSEESLKSTVGLQSSYVFQLGKTTTLTPQIRAQWQHEYLDTARGIGASFLPGGSFTVYGPNMGRDSLLLDVGTSMQLTQTVGIYAFYTGNLAGKNYTSHAINGGVQLSF